jgi:predicted AlkP superfamily phosphohydrolase/phosphomutase
VQSPKLKALVIGLDGATWHTIRPLLDRLPNLRRLVQEGASGNLRSTIPDLTPPAWASFMTGQEPGKHGIFWFGRNDANAVFAPASSSQIRSETLWHMLNRHGLSTGVFNVPMTYPPQPVDGFLVAGMLTPDLQSTFAHPPELSDTLRDQGYILDVRWKEYLGSDPLLLLDRLGQMLDRRGEVLLRLLDAHPVDALVAVFVVLDRIYHCLWGYAVENNDALPDYERIHKGVVGLTMQVDAWVGRLLKYAAPEGLVLVMSDHGHGPMRAEVFMNRWLLDLGLLVPKRLRGTWRSRLKGLAKVMGLSDRGFGSLLGKQGLSRLKEITDAIDWSRTRAYGVWNGVRINLQGRERLGIVQPGAEYEAICDEIITQAAEWRDPRIGQQIVTKAWRKEELYHGPYVDQAHADVILVFSGDGYGGGRTSFDVPTPLMPTSAWSSGMHRPEGLFIIQGPAFCQGTTVTGARIVDVVPILLHALGLPVPAGLDGKPLADAFAPSYWSAHPIMAETPHDADLSLAPESGDADSEAVAERLRGLGYL